MTCLGDKMKIDEFKSHTITRSSPKPKNEYSYYKNDLRQDFCGRCAYCNLSDDSITTPFEIDHFIPKTAFKDIRPELLTDYNNLIYSCKKCNNAKRGQFSGDLSVSHPTNELFYDPVLVDYNNIFYRNELGAIALDDAKGKHMIEILKLYRPIHILGWLCEKINTTADKLQKAIECENDLNKKDKLERALTNIESQYRKYYRIFIACYNDDSFSILDCDT